MGIEWSYDKDLEKHTGKKFNYDFVVIDEDTHARFIDPCFYVSRSDLLEIVAKIDEVDYGNG